MTGAILAAVAMFTLSLMGMVLSTVFIRWLDRHTDLSSPALDFIHTILFLSPFAAFLFILERVLP